MDELMDELNTMYNDLRTRSRDDKQQLAQAVLASRKEAAEAVSHRDKLVG